MRSDIGMTDKFLHPAIPAATVVLFREQNAAPPELLMVERSAKMAFAPGALAFPGGRVDDDDHYVARQFSAGLDMDEAAGRVAAIRETLEETGVAIGFVNDVDANARSAMRRALHAGVLFSELLRGSDHALQLEMLVPFARWRPNFAEARIFDARFYLALAPRDQDADHIDDGENFSLFWATAADTLSRCDAGEARIIFPTRRNLERLATYGDFAAAVADAVRYDGARMITPWIEDRADGRYLCIPDDQGYPVTTEAIETAMRG